MSISNVATTVSPSSATPISMPIPVSLPELSSSSLPGQPTNVDEQMKDRLDSLRQPAVQKEKPEKHVHFEFDTPTGATSTYPGLDGHPR